MNAVKRRVMLLETHTRQLKYTIHVMLTMMVEVAINSIDSKWVPIPY